MRAADTNVLVRILARDDEKQTKAADAFVAKGAWVSLFVLQEAVWVLSRAYKVERKAQGTVIEMLLQHESLVLESPELVWAALRAFRATPRVDFSDCLVLASARRAKHLPVVTFDRHFAKIPDVELLRADRAPGTARPGE